ncbi:hypothetical protein [Streptomyces hydrogenans]|uniref:hypothetical protein n=1 Tax=Streptomyces hydrogenans TaxID=1873719 RepID=UPI0033B8B659
MPRKTAAALRLDAVHRSHLRDYLHRSSRFTPHTRRQAARFEADRGLPVQALEHAVRCWQSFARRPGRPLYLPRPHLPGYDVWDERLLIERAVGALDRRAAREIASVVEEADAVFLARTLPDPRTPPAWPWWRRRCHDLGDIMNVPSQAHVLRPDMS